MIQQFDSWVFIKDYKTLIRKDIQTAMLANKNGQLIGCDQWERRQNQGFPQIFFCGFRINSDAIRYETYKRGR